MRRASLSSRLALEYPGVPPLLGVGDVQQRDKQGRELAQTNLVETARPVTRANALGFVSDESRCRTRGALLPTPRASIYIIWRCFLRTFIHSFNSAK